jgi:alpha-glucosidase
MQYFMHNFLKEQHDLNVHNADLQQELLDVAPFWMERGVDGFRLHTINFYFHYQQLRDNPAFSVADRNATIAPEVNPYNWQNHLYDKNQPENLAFMLRIRAVLDEYPATTVLGEWGTRNMACRSRRTTRPAMTKCTCAVALSFCRGLNPRLSGFARC